MQPISKSKLKARMLEVFREIEKSGEDLIVTDHGVAVLRISPLRTRASVDQLFGSWRGKLVFHEDPNTPTTDEWPET